MTTRDSYEVLFAPVVAGPADEVLDLPAGMEVIDAAEALDAAFAGPDRPDEIDLQVGGERLGRVSREHLLGTTRELADSDGATLPGRSFKYRLIRLRCPVCGSSVLRIYLDDRNPPACPAGHGPMTQV